MPFSVSCKSCGSRFLMGDDLFRRKVAGKVVTVRCRHCSAEINVDASDSTPGRSWTPQPLPPRPPRPGALEGRLVALSPGLLSTPEPARPNQTLKGLSAPELAPPAPEREEPEPPSAPMLADEFVEELPPSVPSPPAVEPELGSSDFSEIPESPVSEPPSSGTPTLHALTAHAHLEDEKPRRDDFELAFGPSHEPLFGPPTIDVSDLNNAPRDAPEGQRGAITFPLFEMGTGLDLLPDGAKASPASSPARDEPRPAPSSAPPSASGSRKKRRRKRVVAPPAESRKPARSEPAERRSGSAIWAAIAVVGVIGGGIWFSRDRAASRVPEPSMESPALSEPAPETPPAPAPEPAPVEPPALATAAPQTPPPTSSVPPSAAPPAAAERPEVEARATAAEPAKPTASAAPAASAAVPAPEPSTAAASEQAEAPPAPSEPFNKAAAIAALESAAAEASSCRRPGDPSGLANVVVTFAPSGRVTTANVSGLFAGTQTGSCVASKLRRAKIPAFSGEHTTVSKTVVIQ